MARPGIPLAALALAVAAGSAAGQAFLYASDYGSGGVDSGNQTLTSLQAPLSFQLQDAEEDGFGVRLRVPVTFGIVDLDEKGLAAVEQFETLSIVAHVELQVPVDETWTLIPLVGFGAAHEFETSQTLWLGTCGMMLRADRELGSSLLTVAGALRYAIQIDSSGASLESFGRTELGVDLQRGLGWSLSGHDLTPGVYSRAFFYWDGVDFSVPEAGTVTIDEEYELGLSLGTAPKVEVFGLGLPRVFVGYRFGDGLSGLRITFGEIL